MVSLRSTLLIGGVFVTTVRVVRGLIRKAVYVFKKPTGTVNVTNVLNVLNVEKKKNDVIDKTSRDMGVHELQIRHLKGAKNDAIIIFFHGFEPIAGSSRVAWWDTWARGQDAHLWPRQLPPSHRILSVCWDARFETCPGLITLYLATIALKVQRDIVAALEDGDDYDCDDWDDCENCDTPIILVGHSVGALLIKEVIMIATQLATACTSYDCCVLSSLHEEKRRAKSFLSNLKGIVFYEQLEQPEKSKTKTQLDDVGPMGYIRGLGQLLFGGLNPAEFRYRTRLWYHHHHQNGIVFNVLMKRMHHLTDVETINVPRLPKTVLEVDDTLATFKKILSRRRRTVQHT